MLNLLPTCALGALVSLALSHHACARTDAPAAAAVLGLGGGSTVAATAFQAPAQKGTAEMNAPAASAGSAAAPTVVLVHGAFADSSGWSDVIQRLRAAGVRAHAVSNPLRGIASDAAYVASALRQVPGPVLAVGHSYGGAVITNAAPKAPNVVGLVFVAAFAPDEGETLGAIEEGSKDSVLNTALLQLQYPNGAQTGVEFAIDPSKFHDAFAADLPPAQTAVMAATQRPVSALAFTERSGPAGWRSLPSWAVVPRGDKAAGSDVLLTMAKRAKATITEVEGSHVIMISRPDVVADTILKALAGLRVSSRAEEDVEAGPAIASATR